MNEQQKEAILGLANMYKETKAVAMVPHLEFMIVIQALEILEERNKKLYEEKIALILKIENRAKEPQ